MKNQFVQRLLLLSTIAGSFVFGACSSSSDSTSTDLYPVSIEECENLSPSIKGNSEKLNNVTKRVAASTSKFGLELLKQLSVSANEENIFLSPVSIQSALGMLHIGASGETQAQMSSAISMSDLTEDEIAVGMCNLRRLLARDENGVLNRISNSYWLNKPYQLKADYRSKVSKAFSAELNDRDFQDIQGVTAEINTWVSRSTAGMISQVLEAVNPEFFSYLINAIYFKGKWLVPFKKEETLDQQPFHQVSGDPLLLPRMKRNGSFHYVQRPDYRAISLPYGVIKKEGAIVESEMVILLPETTSNLSSFLLLLTQEELQAALNSLSGGSSDGIVGLPRFKVNYSGQLKNTLVSLGMADAFDEDRADFSKMTDQRVVVDFVQHDATMEVDEEGTKAAAVTTIGVRPISLPPNFGEFIVDRPFLVMIRDKSGAITFMGWIQRPDQLN